ncbi:MAG: chemotaxis response regulator protein-glutamate methylesterase [Firmicutes bacterium]|nr:chemotaxis response regulator protein-glutamate methylesterase [Bacillota bacterium]
MAVRVLVVDDSTFAQQILTGLLSKDPELEIIGVAVDGEDALRQIAQFHPDVVTLDIEMPKMNGLDCLAKIMEKSPTPVIMVSYLTVNGAEHTIKALELGAVDFVTKPSKDDADLEKVAKEIIQKVKLAASIKVDKLQKVITDKKARSLTIKPPKSIELITIGSSTGGPRALRYLLGLFPENFPLGIVVAQHMPVGFTQVFANHLNDVCDIEISEAKDGDPILPGKVLIAPSGKQIVLERASNEELIVKTSKEPVLIYKPSVNHFLKSVAAVCHEKVLSIILTGMGSDGAISMQELRNLGARTIAEAEESCVVFGMPRAAIELDGVEFVESLPNIYPRIIDILSKDE